MSFGLKRSVLAEETKRILSGGLRWRIRRGKLVACYATVNRIDAHRAVREMETLSMNIETFISGGYARSESLAKHGGVVTWRGEGRGPGTTIDGWWRVIPCGGLCSTRDVRHGSGWCAHRIVCPYSLSMPRWKHWLCIRQVRYFFSFTRAFIPSLSSHFFPPYMNLFPIDIAFIVYLVYGNLSDRKNSQANRRRFNFPKKDFNEWRKKNV